MGNDLIEMQHKIYDIISQKEGEYMSQEDVWASMIEIHPPKKPLSIETRKKFHDAYVGMITKYDDIKIKIENEQCLISVVAVEDYDLDSYMIDTPPERLFSSSNILETLVENQSCKWDSCLDANGNTLLHLLSQKNEFTLLDKYLKTVLYPDLELINHEGKTAFDIGTDSTRILLNRHTLRQSQAQIHLITNIMTSIDNNITEIKTILENQHHLTRQYIMHKRKSKKQAVTANYTSWNIPRWIRNVLYASTFMMIHICVYSFPRLVI